MKNINITGTKKKRENNSKFTKSQSNCQNGIVLWALVWVRNWMARIKKISWNIVNCSRLEFYFEFELVRGLSIKPPGRNPYENLFILRFFLRSIFRLLFFKRKISKNFGNKIFLRIVLIRDFWCLFRDGYTVGKGFLSEDFARFQNVSFGASTVCVFQKQIKASKMP